MPAIPRDPAADSTLALLSEGYAFAPGRFRRFRSDIFETRLMLRRAICVRGEDAARMFYVPGRFTRRFALPPTSLRLLQDRGSALLLDGDAHRNRKRMMMTLAADASARVPELMAERWLARLALWERAPRVVLLPEVRRILTEAVCEWAGVPLSEAGAAERAREFGAMVEGAGSAGPRAARGLALRARTEQWARMLVRTVRLGQRRVDEGSALQVIASYREPDGRLLPVEAAAVELINLLRPTTAVDRYIVFAALAMHRHPGCRERIGDDGYLDAFVQEVRRFYPFFPMVGGRVIEPFEWRGRQFPAGAWVLLDLYGTLHDERAFDAPNEFRPERFERRAPGAFDLIPQGGGDPAVGHRCAGEGLTVALMKRAVRLLAHDLRYDVPPQDLRIDLRRIPAAPNSGFVLAGVRRADS